MRVPVGSCVRGACSCEPTSVGQDLAEVVLSRPALGERLLESGDSFGQRWDVLADGRQHVARDVEGPVLALDLVDADYLGAVLHVREGAYPIDDLLCMLGVEKVLSSALA